MKIEKITENKIRIIINFDDLKAKNIDVHSIMSNSLESQSLFQDLLKEAEKTVGFFARDSKLLIEALASSDGHFIFTITKVVPEQEKDYKKRNLKVKRKSAKVNVKKAIYCFDNFEIFCSFCTYLKNSKQKNLRGFAKNISLYLYKDLYFLVITDINLSYKHLGNFFASISEFAKSITNAENFESRLIEYGKPIMKTNAINRCMRYFG